MMPILQDQFRVQTGTGQTKSPCINCRGSAALVGIDSARLGKEQGHSAHIAEYYSVGYEFNGGLALVRLRL
jgi:hypothetical protein